VKRLIVVRHAKSSWDDPAIPDRDRPLAPRGRKALPALAAHLDRIGSPPTLALCSSARRTVETLGGLRAALRPDSDVSVEDTLYGASADELLDRLQHVEEHHQCVLLIGHNPGVEDLVDLVAAGSTEIEKFPTAASAVLVFDRPWRDLGPGAASLESFWTPR
jgi:phosphohistidine phosphatase